MLNKIAFSCYFHKQTLLSGLNDVITLRVHHS